MARGFMGYIGIAPEPVWGTPVAASLYFEAMSESIISVKERFNVRNIVGRMSEPDDEGGINRHTGDIVVPGHPVPLGLALKGGLGVNSVTVILSGSLYRNDFTAAQADTGSRSSLPAYTLEIFRDIVSADQFYGAQFNTVQFSIAPSQDLRTTIGIIAKGHNIIAPSAVQGAVPFPSSPLGVFKFDTCSISLASAAVDRVEAWNLTIDNQLVGYPALNLSTDVARIQRNSAPQIRMTGTIAIVDHTDYLNFINETDQSMKVNLTKGNSFAILFDIPRFIFTAHPHAMPGRDRITIQFTAMCRYHSGSGTPLKVSLWDIRTY